MSSVIADALEKVRYSRRHGQQAMLLWHTSIATAVEDPGKHIVGLPREFDGRVNNGG
jgi:hypothetical protein